MPFLSFTSFRTTLVLCLGLSVGLRGTREVYWAQTYPFGCLSTHVLGLCCPWPTPSPVLPHRPGLTQL